MWLTSKGVANINIRERILLSLSKGPEINDYCSSDGEMTIDNALSLLTRVYPSFGNIVSGKRVVDFGCGLGYQSIALAQKYGCSVVGIDSNQKTLEKAIEVAKSHNIPQTNVCLMEKISVDMINNFDVVISQNSFEHFGNPPKVLDEMRSLLNESGRILVTFGPPWLAPYGSHMHFFCKMPWINVLFPEEVVMKVRTRFRSDGATKYEDVESGLNKMTIAKFEHIISASKLKIEFKNYECVKGIDLLSRLPLLREFFINHVTVILSKVT